MSYIPTGIRFLMLCGFLLPGLTGRGGVNDFPSGARASGMANSSLVFTDIWAVSNNPAAMVFNEDAGAAICYENRFALKQTGSKGLVIGSPLKKGAAGLALYQFGYSAYKEGSISLAYGHRLGENFSGGMELLYLYTSIKGDYGKRGSFAASLSLFGELSDEVKLGFHIHNINRASLSEYRDERYPTIMGLGLGYDLSTKVKITLETTKNLDHRASFRSGIEYKVHKILALRTGVSTAPLKNYFGVGIHFGKVFLDISTVFFSKPGLSSQISLSTSF